MRLLKTALPVFVFMYCFFCSVSFPPTAGFYGFFTEHRFLRVFLPGLVYTRFPPTAGFYGFFCRAWFMPVFCRPSVFTGFPPTAGSDIRHSFGKSAVPDFLGKVIQILFKSAVRFSRFLYLLTGIHDRGIMLVTVERADIGIRGIGKLP